MYFVCVLAVVLCALIWCAVCGVCCWWLFSSVGGCFGFVFIVGVYWLLVLGLGW